MPKTVIILEDDPFLKEFYKFVFKKIDCSLLILEDGDLFFEKLESLDVGLILMDINLRNTYLNEKKMDGVKLSQLVKNNKNYSHIPIIIVTAYPSEKADRNLFEESLADDYFTKPIKNLNYFLDKINNYLLKPCPKIEC